jgi:hypothetical protein
MKNMIIYFLFSLLSLVAIGQTTVLVPQQSIKKGGMELSYSCDTAYLHLNLSAPTRGWLAIGFNDRPGIEGTYLLMARVQDGRAEVVAHYTIRPGNYQSLVSLGETEQCTLVSGSEVGNRSLVSFSLPLNRVGKYQKALVPGNPYHLILAYSRDDDFQHHSTMRTSLKFTLCP